MKPVFVKSILLGLIAILCTAGLVNADVLNNNEVQFTGAVKTVTVNGESVGTLFVQLETIDLRVLINAKTILQDQEGQIITMDGLSTLTASADPEAGPMVEVTGKFSSSGILANRVRVVDAASDFNIRGHITAIQLVSDSQALISLLGITVLADTGSELPTTVQSNGMDIPLNDLRIGTNVLVQGSILKDGTWAASQIKELTAKKKSLVLFEGTVQTYDSAGSLLKVLVNGPNPKNITDILITTDTIIPEDLTVGDYVLVIGTFNPDYSFTAIEIRVLAALEIKPDDRKLAVGQTATFTVKLRMQATEDVTVDLSVAGDGALDPPPPATLFISAGEQTGSFEVRAASIGSVTITAKALGEEATAVVTIGEISEDDTEPPAGQVRIYFSPDHIKLKPGESREVVLHIQPPQKTEVVVGLTSSDESVVALPTTRPLSNGAAMFKVLIQSTGLGGNASVVAALPEELGGYLAELVVEVGEKKGK